MWCGEDGESGEGGENVRVLCECRWVDDDVCM